jgi:hypothetical protein
MQAKDSMLSADADAFVPSAAKPDAAAQRLQLHCQSSEQARCALLVASVSGVRERLDMSEAAESLSLTTETGEAVEGINTICRYLAGIGGRSAQLLGRTPEEQAQAWSCAACGRRQIVIYGCRLLLANTLSHTRHLRAHMLSVTEGKRAHAIVIKAMGNAKWCRCL